jgi:hypothetical protein
MRMTAEEHAGIRMVILRHGLPMYNSPTQLGTRVKQTVRTSS